MNDLLDAMSHDISHLSFAERLSGSLLVAGISIVIVFGVLIGLIGVLRLTGALLAPRAVTAPTPARPPVDTDSAPSASPRPGTDAPDSAELIAVITAALACALDEPTSDLRLTRIQRLRDPAPVWARTGRQEQLLPARR